MDYPFRVQSAATSQQRVNAIVAQGLAPVGVQPAPPQAGADPVQQYLGRVIALIPAEVIALYQGVHGAVESASKAGDVDATFVLSWLPWVGLLLVIFVRAWGTRDSTGSLSSIQWPAVAIASVSFAVWVISLGHVIAEVPIDKPWIGSVLLMVWPFFIPYIYKGE